ncbi:MAG: MCP four helix bundle domain-containing protein, partial [Janthinobacterium lividum]
MPFLSDVTIRNKIALAFVVVVGSTVGLGAFGLQRMGAINAAAEEVRNNSLPSAVMLGQLRAAMQQYRIKEGRYILSPAAEKEAEEVNLNGGAQGVVKARQAYDAMIDPGEERERFQRIDALWNEYTDIHRQLISLSRSGRTDEATASYKEASAKSFNAVMDLVNQGMEYNRRTGVEAADRGAQIYRTTWWLMASALAATVVLAGLVGLLLVRAVSSPLTSMTAVMRRLADRDMSAQIEGVGRGDEIGAMAGAVQVFKDSMVTADRLAGEQQSDRAGKEQRAVRLAGMVQAFEASVGGMAGMLSSASTELEATAQAMTSTAERTNAQAGTVASAAEE